MVSCLAAFRGTMQSALPNCRQSATRKVSIQNSVAGGFATLRDQFGVNEIQASELRTIKKLGEGAFAVVEQALYTPLDGRPPVMVAVKKLRPAVMGKKEDLDSFLSEISVLRKLKHPYIMDYIGIGSTDTSSDERRQATMFLVAELMQGGTLKKLVMSQMIAPHTSLYTMADGLRWCVQIAKALAYLHNAKPMVIHRDLKLENILLKGTTAATQEANVADFGLVAFVSKKQPSFNRITLTMDDEEERKQATRDERKWDERSRSFIAAMNASKLLSPSMRSSPSVRSLHTDLLIKSLQGSLHVLKGSFKRLSYDPQDSANLMSSISSVIQRSKAQLTGRTGTLMYMAPEMFKNQKYDEKVDVFSFAVIMYEILHKYMMVFAVSVKGTEQEIERYAERVSEGWRPPVNEKFPPELISIITDAWKQDPKERPSMSEIAKRLAQVQQDGVMQVQTVDPGCGCVVS